MQKPRRRKPSKKLNKKNHQVLSFSSQDKEMIGLFIIIFGILSGISLFSPNMGLFGRGLVQVYQFLVGLASLPLAIYFLILGGLLVSKEHGFSKKRLLYFLTVLFFSLLVYYQFQGPWIKTMGQEMKLLFKSSDPYKGGVLGIFFGRIFMKLFGSTGTIIVFSIVLLVLFFYFLPISWKEVGTLIQIKAEKGKGKRRERQKKRAKKEEARKTPLIKEEKIPRKKDSLEETPLEIYDYSNHGKEKVDQKAEALTSEDMENFSKEIQKEEPVNYIFPPLEILNRPKPAPGLSKSLVREKAHLIEDTMRQFNIDCKVMAINRGPVITCYELQIAPGVKLNKIVSLSDNLSLALASPDIRIEAPIPGKSAVGIEVPNESKDQVVFREILESPQFKKSSTTPLALGKDVSGNIIISSIDKMPHLLIAGATGSGKSVCINTIITSILYRSRPDQVKFILIDPKVVELNVYNGIPHLLIPVVTDPKKAAFALRWAVDEMEKRYKSFAKEHVRDMKSFNQKMEEEKRYSESLAKIVVIVDELADLMMVAANEIEDYIARLAQMARAAGIYMILATQRPSVDVITGTIKANIPSRVAFAVSSGVDSRTILDSNGAEHLLGQGDMLFYPSFYSKPKRLQGAFISDQEVENVVSFIKDNSQKDYNEEALESIEKKVEKETNPKDDLYSQAVNIVLQDEQASISYLQRKLKIGYSRAARLIDSMEEDGIIGPHQGTQPRKIILSDDQIKEFLESD